MVFIIELAGYKNAYFDWNFKALIKFVKPITS